MRPLLLAAVAALITLLGLVNLVAEHINWNQSRAQPQTLKQSDKPDWQQSARGTANALPRQLPSPSSAGASCCR